MSWHDENGPWARRAQRQSRMLACLAIGSAVVGLAATIVCYGLLNHAASIGLNVQDDPLD